MRRGVQIEGLQRRKRCSMRSKNASATEIPATLAGSANLAFDGRSPSWFELAKQQNVVF